MGSARFGCSQGVAGGGTRGGVGKEGGEDGRVPAQLCRIISVPLMLEPPDAIELRVRDGKVDQIM